MKKKPAKRTRETAQRPKATKPISRPRAKAKPSTSSRSTSAKPSPRARTGNDLPVRGPRAAKAGTSAKPRTKRPAARSHPVSVAGKGTTPRKPRAPGRGTSPVAPVKGKPAIVTPRKRAKAPAPPQRRAPAPATRAAPAAKAPPRRPVARPAPRPQPKLSQSPAAKRARAARRAAELERDQRNKRARTRYAERRGIAQQRAAEATAKREAAKARKKIAGRGRGKRPGKVVDERALAIGWLEAIREHFAAHVPTSFDVTEAEIGAKTPWLVVGRYDFLEAMDYETLAHALDDVAGDLILEASIHPSRLSQIRILFIDPKAKRGESDSFVSKIGSWEMVVSDLIGELIGGGDDDEGALANRYAETTVPGLYVYFSSEIVNYRTAPGFENKKTQSIKMK